MVKALLNWILLVFGLEIEVSLSSGDSGRSLNLLLHKRSKRAMRLREKRDTQNFWASL